MIRFTEAATEAELLQILALQAANMRQNISAIEAADQGFLTVGHDLEILRAMNQPLPHTLAKSGDNLAGYALSMPKSFAHSIPMLVPMFEQIDQQIWQNRPLSEVNYMVMGQICVAKEYRGQQVFSGLYETMDQRIKAAGYECIVTEIASHNARSLRAHARSGFLEMNLYTADGIEWVLVVLA
jgi:predicted GNAT superfamily acetyltransferase